MRRLEASLLENTSLASLTLKGNNLKWPHVELLFPALQKNRHLEYLDVGSNAFGDKAFASLTTALFHHPALHTLKASADNLGNDAMLYTSLLLEFNPSLTSLFLCGLPPSPSLFSPPLLTPLSFLSKTTKLDQSAQLFWQTPSSRTPPSRSFTSTVTSSESKAAKSWR